MDKPLRFIRRGLVTKSIYKNVSDYCNLEFKDKEGHTWRCCAFVNSHRWDELFQHGIGTWIKGYQVYDKTKRLLRGDSCPIIIERSSEDGKNLYRN